MGVLNDFLLLKGGSFQFHLCSCLFTICWMGDPNMSW